MSRRFSSIGSPLVNAIRSGVCPLLVQADIAADLAIAGIDAESILYVYSWGMGAVLSSWAIGYATGIVKEVIKAL